MNSRGLLGFTGLLVFGMLCRHAAAEELAVDYDLTVVDPSRHLARIEVFLDNAAGSSTHLTLTKELSLENLAVEKRPWSQETQIRDLSGGDIALAPLPDDRFTRRKCGFKILQYAAVGLSVVASPVGVNAEYVQDGVTGFQAGDVSVWVDKTAHLIEDKELRRRMGQAATTWVRQFDAACIGRRLVATLEKRLRDR